MTLAGALADVLVGALAVGLLGWAWRRPHRVDNPVGNGALPPAWGTWAAALERVPVSVRADFLPTPTLGELLSDDGWPPDGELLVPDDVDVTDLAHGITVLRVPRAAVGQIRYSQGGPIAPAGQPPGWRRGRRRGEPPWVPLIPVRSSIPGPPPRGRQVEPTVPPRGGSGVSDAVMRSLAAEARRVAAEARQRVPREGPRPNPGRPSWH